MEIRAFRESTALAVIAQNAGLAHGVAWVVAATAGPDRWDAICCPQFAGVARWTWSHNSGRPSGNIWPLSSSVATNLTSESFMRAPQYSTMPSVQSRSFILPGWASALSGNDLARSFVHFVQRRSESLSKSDRIPHGPEVHKKEPRLFVQHVAVNGRDLKPVLTKSAQHWIHLSRAEHEVTRGRSVPRPRR